jgi:hypothetical protein
VLNGDGDPDNYDLAAGDQPAITGDQMLWWVMNDVGNVHENTETPPLGIEVRVNAFGFGQGPAALRQSTFYRLEVVNRNVHRVEDAYVSLFMDPDLGDAADDYVGSDTTLQMGLVFNGDNQDGNGSGGTYGTAPPALGVQFVRAPAGGAGVTGNLSAMMYFIGGATYPQSDPNSGVEIYHVMRGRWVDGSPLTEAGTGLNPGGAPVTTYAFAGDPVAPQFWSMRCPGSPASCGSPMAPQDMRLVASSGPALLESGSSAELLIALPFGRGETNLASIIELRRAAQVILNANEAGLLAPRRVPGFLDPPTPNAIELRRPAPNPFDDSATIELTLPAAAGVRVALVDVLGREVIVALDGTLEAGAHEVTIYAAGLAPGVYLARVWVAGQEAGALPVTRR